MLGFGDEDVDPPLQHFLCFCSESGECDEPGTFVVVEVNRTNYLNKRVMGVDLSDWHNYTILWEPDNATFLIDGEVLAQSMVEPSLPLGIIIHMENRAIVNGSKIYLDIEEDQFVEVDYVRVFMDGDLYEEYRERTADLLNSSLQQIESVAASGLNVSRLASDHSALMEQFDAGGYVHAGNLHILTDFLTHVDELIGLFDAAAEGIGGLDERDKMIAEMRYLDAEHAWLNYEYQRTKAYLEGIIEKASG
jgi:hypothetical protein